VKQVQEESAAAGSNAASVGHADPSFADAAASARDLIGRLASVLEVHESNGSTMAILRGTQDVLARLSRPASVIDTGDSAVQTPEQAADIIIDVSDLLGYFEHNRLPTGIQRVQAELIFNMLQPAKGPAARLCCFVNARNQWVEVDSAMFRELCLQSRAGGAPTEPGWMAMVSRMRLAIDASVELAFPRGSMLVNVGTSWWVPNYFLYVRQAKARYGIRYVPLVHDLIPMLMPDYCDRALVEAFIAWFIGVLDHSDFYLAVSESTRNDMVAFAQKLGRPIASEGIGVIRWDADFRQAESRPLPAARRFAEPFVLFVSTLEARKNQMGALDAWLTLVARHGAEKVPRLVLVGKRGFKSDQILDRLQNNAVLRERVTILSGVEDVELQTLYRDCLFTIYPSFYEGWGLPVTESLCHGKVVLVTDNSSLPEAGGSWAAYVKTGSTADMVAMLERLILNDEFRQQQERMIRDEFRPRSWVEIAGAVTEHVRRWMQTAAATGWQVPLAETGAYYPLQTPHSTRVWPGMGSAEAFREGSGWRDRKEPGCWTDPHGAELRLRLPDTGARRLGLELACPLDTELRYRVDLVGSEVSAAGLMEGEQSARWVFLDLPENAGDANHVVTIRFTSTVLSHLSRGDGSAPGVGLRGFFLFGADATARLDFLEAVALGALPDLNFYRDRSLHSTDA